jgi:hypothetical protein
VAGCVVLPQETNGKALSPRDGILLLGGKPRTYREPADVRQMLLKVILRLAFHGQYFKAQYSKLIPLQQKNRVSLGDGW